MRLVKSDMLPPHAEKKRKHKTRNQQLAEDFLETGWACAKVVEHEWWSEHEAVNSLNTTFKRRRYPILAFAVNGNVYLRRKEE